MYVGTIVGGRGGGGVLDQLALAAYYILKCGGQYPPPHTHTHTRAFSTSKSYHFVQRWTIREDITINMLWDTP